VLRWTGTDACCNYCGHVPAQNFGEMFFSMCTKHFSLDPHNLFASKHKNKNKKAKPLFLKQSKVYL
jgi:hypothetical protein